MYYHLQDHIYIAGFRNEMILLDTKTDKYTVCFENLSAFLHKLMGATPSIFESLDPKETTYLEELLDNNIIERKSSPYPFAIDQKISSQGVSNVDWRLPLQQTQGRFSVHVLKALLMLLKVHFYMKFRGFYATLQLIKQASNDGSHYKIPLDSELHTLVGALNKACQLYPIRTKCLEWAITFVLLALQRGWKCNLEIGVQNYPFLAHAWVECNGRAVMDSPDLREGLAIILNEPFRRLKQ